MKGSYLIIVFWLWSVCLLGPVALLKRKWDRWEELAKRQKVSELMHLWWKKS